MTSPLIRQINSIVDSDARPQARMVRPRVRGDEAATQVSEKQDEVRRQSGKDDNLKQLKCLRQEVNDSYGISLTDKAKLNQALAELGANLDAEKVAANHALKFDNQDLLEAQFQHERYIDEAELEVLQRTVDFRGITSPTDKKRTGFHRSEFREETHENCVAPPSTTQIVT